MSISRSGAGNPRARLGVIESTETLKKKSESMLGKNKGKVYGKQSPELIERRIGHLRGIPRPTSTCPHCNKVGGATQMVQWHFDKCKKK
jgi:hypothetical protein